MYAVVLKTLKSVSIFALLLPSPQSLFVGLDFSCEKRCAVTNSVTYLHVLCYVIKYVSAWDKWKSPAQWTCWSSVAVSPIWWGSHSWAGERAGPGQLEPSPGNVFSGMNWTWHPSPACRPKLHVAQVLGFEEEAFSGIYFLHQIMFGQQQIITMSATGI